MIRKHMLIPNEESLEVNESLSAIQTPAPYLIFVTADSMYRLILLSNLNVNVK